MPIADLCDVILIIFFYIGAVVGIFQEAEIANIFYSFLV